MSNKPGKYVKVACPVCGGIVAEVDWLLGYSNADGVNPDGTVEFSGETDIDWDSQKPVSEPPIYICRGCSRIYVSISPVREGGYNDVSAVLQVSLDQTWECPGCHTRKVVDYDGLVSDGVPYCKDCGMEFERWGRDDWRADGKGKRKGKPVQAPSPAKAAREDMRIVERVVSQITG